MNYQEMEPQIDLLLPATALDEKEYGAAAEKLGIPTEVFRNVFAIARTQFTDGVILMVIEKGKYGWIWKNLDYNTQAITQFGGIEIVEDVSKALDACGKPVVVFLTENRHLVWHP